MVLPHRVICYITCTVYDSLSELTGTEVVYTLFSETSLPLWTWHHDNSKPLKASDFPGGASGKESACQWRRCQRHGFNPWVGKNPWRRKWQPTAVFLPGEWSPWTEEPGGLQPVGTQRVGYDWACTHRLNSTEASGARWVSTPKSSWASANLLTTLRTVRS